VQSPGREILGDPKRHDELKAYVTAMISRYKDDPRVLGWDLFNEPDNPNRQAYGIEGANFELGERDKERLATQLLRKTFLWARSVNPSQPLTVGVWLNDYLNKPTEIQRVSLNQSDVISFHNYDGPEQMKSRIIGLQKYNRPILCTEYMARGNNSTFRGNLPLMKEYKVGAWNWGLVDGKSQTIYPWDSWRKPYTKEPDPWFHDIFRANGEPYSVEETALIRRLAGEASQASTSW